MLIEPTAMGGQAGTSSMIRNYLGFPRGISGAAIAEAPALAGQDVFVVGGGNSAGQAAVHLAKFASRVTVLVRSETLAQSMSDYLITEIDATDNIDVKYGVEVAGGSGDGRLETVDVRHRRVGRRLQRSRLPHSSSSSAPSPSPTGFRPKWRVTTGDRRHRTFGRQPVAAAVRATVPGVFAVGDVRRDSTKASRQRPEKAQFACAWSTNISPTDDSGVASRV